jgi:DNA polymerase-3 subunit gamma/tau
VKFFFATTEPHKVPLTIQSRCQKFDLQRIRLETIASKLESIVQDQKLVADPVSLSLIAEAAQGSMRDAESLLDQLLCTSNGALTLDVVRESLGKVSKEGLFSIDIAIQNRSIEDLKKASDVLLLSGKETSLLIEDLAEHFRNHLLALQKSLDPKFYHLSPKETQSYQELSQGYTQASLLEMLELIYPFFHQPTRPFLSQQQFETLLILLMKKNHRPSLSLIVERLEALEKKLERRILPSSPASVEATLEQVEALANKSASIEAPPVEPLENGMKTDERGSKEHKAEHPSSHQTEPSLSFSPSISEITAPLKSSDASGDPPLKLLPASVRHQNLIQFAIVEWNAVLQ